MDTILFTVVLYLAGIAFLIYIGQFVYRQAERQAYAISKKRLQKILKTTETEIENLRYQIDMWWAEGGNAKAIAYFTSKFDAIGHKYEALGSMFGSIGVDVQAARQQAIDHAVLAMRRAIESYLEWSILIAQKDKLVKASVAGKFDASYAELAQEQIEEMEKAADEAKQILIDAGYTEAELLQAAGFSKPAPSA